MREPGCGALGMGGRRGIWDEWAGGLWDIKLYIWDEWVGVKKRLQPCIRIASRGRKGWGEGCEFSSRVGASGQQIQISGWAPGITGESPQIHSSYS